MTQNWDEHRMRNTEKTTKRTQISTKRANTYFLSNFHMEDITKYQGNSKKCTVKISGIFDKIFACDRFNQQVSWRE